MTDHGNPDHADRIIDRIKGIQAAQTATLSPPSPAATDVTAQPAAAEITDAVHIEAARAFLTSLGTSGARYQDDMLLNWLERKSADAVALCAALEAAHRASRSVQRLSQAAIDVLAERRRHVEVEGWTPEHDDQHADGEMARAAACYAISGSGHFGTRTAPRWSDWPWLKSWFKPTTPRRDLVKAGALIIAEIERMDRAALAAEDATR